MVTTDDGSTLGDLLAKHGAQTGLALEYVKMLRNNREASKRAALTYRCPRRCTLLTVYETTQGVILHHPRYKLSAAMNRADSTEAGRRANTEDGDRRWKEGASFLVPDNTYPLICDHVNSSVTSQAILDALERGDREVVRDTSGTE